MRTSGRRDVHCSLGSVDCEITIQSIENGMGLTAHEGVSYPGVDSILKVLNWILGRGGQGMQTFFFIGLGSSQISGFVMSVVPHARSSTSEKHYRGVIRKEAGAYG